MRGVRGVRRMRGVRVVRGVRSERREKSERSERSEKNERSESSERSENPPTSTWEGATSTWGHSIYTHEEYNPIMYSFGYVSQYAYV